jgi:hypothetical protein
MLHDASRITSAACMYKLAAASKSRHMIDMKLPEASFQTAAVIHFIRIVLLKYQ